MTNNKPNDVRVVSVELLEELLDAAKWKAADFTKASPYRSKIDEVVRRTKDLLTQPATAKVDERAEFDRWTVSEGRFLGYTGWHRDFAVWQARAKLNEDRV